jgi:atypical dual specificity phosphatase
VAVIRTLGSVRNFAWVEPGVLARGEQPELNPTTFSALKDEGITAILSLRPDREPPSANSRRPWPEYRMEEEEALAKQVGMRFRNLPITDFSAPSPEQVAAALSILDELVTEQPGVYVHCRAGAGRAGLISAVWAVARGASGDEGADSYVRFMEHVGSAFGHDEDDERWKAFLKRVGSPYVWWALRQIVDALGSPVTREQPRLVAPERPLEADHWEARYRELLAPWRAKRTYAEGSGSDVRQGHRNSFLEREAEHGSEDA